MTHLGRPPGWEDEPPHLLIRASAGSGKTYRLSSRYLRLLRRGARPESILATTFTRKAAGEVLARVVTRLAAATDDDATRAVLAGDLPGRSLTREACLAMLRGLADDLHRLSISTIDSFFNRIAQSFARELDLPPEPMVVDDTHPAVEQVRLDAIEAMLGDADLPGMVALLRQFHHDQAARSVTDALSDIIRQTHEVYRESPTRETWSRLNPNGLLDEDGLQAATKALLDAADDLPKTTKSWTDAYAKNRDAALARDWEEFLKVGLAKAVCRGGGLYYNTPIEGKLLDALTPLIDHAAAKMIERLGLQTVATYDLLHRFDEHYAAGRRRQGLLLFSDLTHKLGRELPAIGDGLIEDIYYRLDGRVTHLLLDEFQDTSLVQWDVLRPFAQEVAATADGSRSLFVVGDAKQAIYGWRGGVAELFDQIEHELALDEQSVTSMSDSYRSSGVVLDVVNRVFGGLTSNGALDAERGAADRWQRSFEEHRPVRDLSGHVTLETSVAAATGDDDGPPPESHERYVARRVQGLYERTGGAGSIGVLVRTNDVGARLISEIGRLGVPVSGEGGGSLADAPAVATVLSALQMADHPGDTASAFHVLNSPMARVVGLTSTDPPQVQLTARRIREMLLNHGYAQTLADWTRALAASCDARGLSRLTQLVALADRSEHVEVLRPSRFVALAEAERVANPKPAPVRVMTVHAAKGLEFDTVVLAELNKTFRDDGPLLLEREHPTGPVTGVYRSANDDVRQLDDRLVRAVAARRADGLMDFISLLYVGMTRARRSLHMMVKPGKLKADGTFASPGLCYAAILREALPCRDEDPAGGQVLYEHGDPGWAPDAAEPEPAREPRQQPIDVPRLGGGGSLPQRFLPTVSPSERAGGEKTVASIMEVSRDTAGAMRYGTMVHEWFRQVGFIDESAEPDRASLRRIARLQMPGTDRARIEAALDRFFEALHSAEASRVLSRKGASELWRERPFVVRHGRELLRGCFDRVSIHRDAAGGVTRAELVDFKTDHVGPEGPEALVGTYRLQLLAYRQALQALLGLDAGSIHTALWFVGPGIVEEVST